MAKGDATSECWGENEGINLPFGRLSPTPGKPQHKPCVECEGFQERFRALICFENIGGKRSNSWGPVGPPGINLPFGRFSSTPGKPQHKPCVDCEGFQERFRALICFESIGKMRLTKAVAWSTILMVVLGGELAVPCTRNPL